MDTKQKYVKLKDYNEVIVFPCTIEHSTFQSLNPMSAGFCYVDADNTKVDCFGESFSLGLKSDPIEDSKDATKQFFGIEAYLKILN